MQESVPPYQKLCAWRSIDCRRNNTRGREQEEVDPFINEAVRERQSRLQQTRTDATRRGHQGPESSAGGAADETRCPRHRSLRLREVGELRRAADLRFIEEPAFETVSWSVVSVLY